MKAAPLKYSNFFLYLSVLLVSLFCRLPVALASPVEVEMLKEQAIVGEPLSFVLKFSLEDDNQAIDVSNVKYKGVALPYEVRSQSSSSFTMIVNGKTVRSSSDSVKSYIFSIPTTEVGPLVLPEFSVSLAGERYRVQSLSFQVIDRPSSDDLQFLVTISNPQPYYYPSQVIDLDCRVLYRNFSGRPEIAEISLPIMKNMSFELLPESRPNFELVINGQRTAVQARQETEKLQGKTYNALGFHLRFRLMSHGNFEFNNHLKMIVETGKTYRQRSFFFGSELVREKAPLYAESSPLAISVLPLPDTDVPASFNGAIGTFSIKVTPSSDTAIRVGDPITLLIEISGRGTWEFVKSPPIHKEPTITDYFIVSQEPVVGDVNEAQTMKSFSVRLRVKSKTVKEIPAIPFTYFNLSSQKYVTVYSDPVPITVFDSATTAQIIDFNAPKDEETQPGKTENSVQGAGVDGQETIPAVGEKNGHTILPEPILPPLIQIRDNVPVSKTRDDHAPDYRRIVFALLPLFGVCLLFVRRWYRRHGLSEEKTAKHKSNKAYKQFVKAVGKLEQSNADLPDFCRSLGRCLHQYLQDRFLCTIPYIDETSLQSLVDQGLITSETARELLSVVDEIDQYRYAAGLSGAPAEAATLLNKTIEVVRKCDM